MDNRRFLLAIILSMLVLIVWGRYFAPPEPPPEPGPLASEPAPAEEPRAEPQRTEPPVERAGSPEAPPGEGSIEPEMGEAPTPELVSDDRERTTVIDTPTYRAELTNRGAQLVSFRLKEHLNAQGQPLDLVRGRIDWPYPFGVVGPNGEPSELNDALFVTEESVGDGRQLVTFRYNGAEGEALKRFAFGDDGLFDVEIELPKNDALSVVLGPGIRNPSEKELENRFARKQAVFRTSDDTENLDPSKASTPEWVPGADLRWVGLHDTYFLTALVFREPVDQVSFQPLLGAFAEGGRMTFRDRPESLSDAEKELVRELDVRVRPLAGRLSAVSYFGPKVYDDLAGQQLGLEKTVALGPFGFLARPLLTGLRWIHDSVVSNYGWAIILMTLLIRIVLFPLNHKSVVSMQRMQELNPKIQAIRQKYRSKLKDKQGRPNAEMQRKQNEEIMALYKQEGVNPAGGCLPLLLQIPVLFAFYSLLSTAIELRYAPWTGWIQDLSAPDPFLVLPIVMGATQFLQQKLTPSAADPAQRRIFMLMPIFFTILFLGFPSGLVLYWLTNNVLGIAQQLGYQRLKERKEAAQA